MSSQQTELCGDRYPAVQKCDLRPGLHARRRVRVAAAAVQWRRSVGRALSPSGMSRVGVLGLLSTLNKYREEGLKPPFLGRASLTVNNVICGW